LVVAVAPLYLWVLARGVGLLAENNAMYDENLSIDPWIDAFALGAVIMTAMSAKPLLDFKILDSTVGRCAILAVIQRVAVIEEREPPSIDLNWHESMIDLTSFVDIEGNIAPEDCFLSRQVVDYPAEDGEVFFAAFIERTRHAPGYASAAL
jgi:hypothetical protein